MYILSLCNTKKILMHLVRCISLSYLYLWLVADKDVVVHGFWDVVDIEL